MFGIFKRKKEETERDYKFDENIDFATDFESIKSAIEARNVQPASMPPQAFASTPQQQPQMPISSVPSFQPPAREVEHKEPLEMKIREEKPELFIKIDKYKEILNLLNNIVIKMKELEGILVELREIKTKESNKLMDWERELEDLKDKINAVLESLKSE